MSGKKLILLAASLLSMTFWGCGSNMDSGGDQTGGTTTLASATTLGITNCLTCHSPYSTLVQDYLVSRHGNHMLAAAKSANDTETPGADPSPSSCNYECHDPYNDGANIDLVQVQASIVAFGNTAKASWATAGSIIGCEGCHGGGQYHNGIKTGIPYATPGPAQCGECHYLNDTLAKATWITAGYYPHHDNSSSGNNIRRNITDTHVDSASTTGAIEGYTIRTSRQDGCVECHFNGHLFDLTRNYQWASSKHGGQLKTLKDAALAAGLPAATDTATRVQHLANVTAVAVTSTTGDAWQHYDWDDTASRGSCQVCHTSTGIANFLSAPTTYDTSGKGNDYSHLSGWVADNVNTPDVVDNVSSGQNEMLFCWGCHSDSKGALRNPGALTLDYTYNSVAVTLPDVRKSNACVKCHGGRGNNDSIRNNNRSSRFAGHHAPTAGSMFAATTHIAYEYSGKDYSGAPAHAAIDTGSTGGGPCVNCHMGGSTEAAAAQKNHNFEATTHSAPTTIASIVHLTTCNTAACHNSVMSVAGLQAQKDGFEAAKVVLAGYMANTITNYLGLDISTTSNNNYRTVAMDAYGAFQNNIYMSEEPCAYVHNARYAKRILFDSINWMDNGVLDATIDLTGYAAAATFLNRSDPINAVTRP